MALFPPIVASSMPAFDVSQGYVKIYYTISNYNQVDQIKGVHVSVRRQDNNVTLVNNKGKEFLEKEFIAILSDEENFLPNGYVVTINNSDLLSQFEVGTLYKIQLRFTTGSGNQIDYSFSLWSTVCIIKPINPPIFYIDDFHYSSEDDNGQNINADDTFLNNFADFIGVYKPNKTTSNQEPLILKSWRVQLYNNADVLQQDTGWQLLSAYNYSLDETTISFKCSLPYEFLDEQLYYIKFDILTKNGFQDSKIYYFRFENIFKATDGSSSFTLKNSGYSINSELGYVKVFFLFQEAQKHNLVIRRSDSKTNFLNWKDLKIFQGHANTSFYYYDFTAESGNAYRYLIQEIDERGRYTYSQKIYNNPIIIPLWDHAFLLEASDDKIKILENNIPTNNIKQLKLKYDFQISSLKTNITENLTNTIGSQYPYIRKNGKNYYKSFPITGTITYYMDNVEFFISKLNLFNGYQDTFSEYNQTNQEFINHSIAYDYIYEKKFRDLVEKFLYNSKPKLYKSTQEGNILIKLMEVSLTPKQLLDRMIYTFSATAYEIGEASILNLNYYNIISIGLIDPLPSWSKATITQINSYKSDDLPFGNVFLAGQDIIGGKNLGTASLNSLAKKNKYKESFNNQVLNDFYLSYLKITMESPPYLIVREGNGYRIYKDTLNQDSIDKIKDINNNIGFGPEITTPLYRLESTYSYLDDLDVYLGYLFEINGLPIIISSNGIYELKDDNLKLPSTTSIVPQKDCILTMLATIHKSFVTDIKNLAARIVAETKVGQLIGTYYYSDLLIKLIRNKYLSNLTIIKDGLAQNIKQSVTGVNSITIEALPGTKIWLNTSVATSPFLQEFIMNETGVLSFSFDNGLASITDLRIGNPLDKNLKNDAIIFYTVNIKKEYFNI